jgi:Dirigent-like protein
MHRAVAFLVRQPDWPSIQYERDRETPWELSPGRPRMGGSGSTRLSSITKRVRAVTLILILGLSLGVSSIPARGADSKAMTIRVISTTTALEVVTDRKPTNALSAGDVLRARSTLRNAVAQFGRSKGAVVGKDVGVVTMVSSSEGSVKVTASLPGGTIRSSGRDTPVPNQSLRVIGGTGRFAGARGVVEVRALDVRTRLALNVYRIQLP